jgi:hypothetical protein
MGYVLGTAGVQNVQWYSFNPNATLQPGQYELLDILDLRRVPQMGDKETAKTAALALGLKTWRYVRL